MAKSWRIYTEDKGQRALCRLIDDYADEALAKVIKDYLVEARKPDSERNEDALAGYRALVEEQLTNLNDLLEGKDFLVADQYSLADISVFSFLKIIEIKDSVELLSRYGNLYRWYQRVQAKYQGD